MKNEYGSEPQEVQRPSNSLDGNTWPFLDLIRLFSSQKRRSWFWNRSFSEIFEKKNLQSQFHGFLCNFTKLKVACCPKTEDGTDWSRLWAKSNWIRKRRPSKAWNNLWKEKPKRLVLEILKINENVLPDYQRSPSDCALNPERSDRTFRKKVMANGSIGCGPK